MTFPINLTQFRGIPINRHPGAFGCPRKFNIHTGVDLYCEEDAQVYAIDDGIVYANELFTGGCDSAWWLETNALLVAHGPKLIIYGELHSKLVKGDTVNRGDVIGNIRPVLPATRIRSDVSGHSNCMLHIEQYHRSTARFSFYNKTKINWVDWCYGENPPLDIIDPTKLLINILQINNVNPEFLHHEF